MNTNGSSHISPPNDQPPIVFASHINSAGALESAYVLAKSIRAFAGKYHDAPIWVFGPKHLTTQNTKAQSMFADIDVELKSVDIPEETSWYYLSGMAFAPAEAERHSAGKAKILAFMACDCIVVQEPTEFILAEGVFIGCSPAHHRNISPLYSESLDAFWSRAYSLMNIDQSVVFPMETRADGDTIRPYYNAGCLSVRPERGLLQNRADIYIDLCKDSALRREAESDERRRIFCFQVALTGAILGTLKRDEMVELSIRYNYPFFFNELFGSKRDFHDITDIATIRYEHFFENPLPNWDKILQGPADRIEWMKKHLVKV